MITVIYMVYRDILYVKSIEIMLLVVELPYMLDVTYIERNDISYLGECVETVLIEIPKYLFEMDNDIIVGTIYHHPGTNLDKFYNKMER